MEKKEKNHPGRPWSLDHKTQRQQEILDRAAFLFAKNGYTHTDLQVVADQLGIGKGTIYRYFPSKENLFFATVDREMQLLGKAIWEKMNVVLDPLEGIAQAIRSYLGFFDSRPHAMDLFIQERAVFRDRKKSSYFEYRDSNNPRWKKLTQKLIQSGRIRKVAPQIFMDVVGDLLYGTVFANYFARRKESFMSQADKIVDVILFGVLTEKEKSRVHPSKKEKA